MLKTDSKSSRVKDHQTLFFPITDESYIGAARRQAACLAEMEGFLQVEIDKIAIIINELGTNLIKHANKFKERTLLFQIIAKNNKKVFEIMAMDNGPGMGNLAQCLQDGYSTVQTAGNGLGAVSRLADFFNVYSLPPSGTIALAHIESKIIEEVPKSSFMEISGICSPIGGETISGDSWSFHQTNKRCMVIVADGLGHGPEASEASELACEVFHQNIQFSPAQILSLINPALRKTRGAAVSIMEIDKNLQQVKFAGLGNVGAAIYSNKKISHMVSHNGTAGVGQFHVQEYTYKWDHEALFLMYSDGLISRWGLAQYPGLTMRRPSLIAGALYRDFLRGNDDATVVVGKQFVR